MPSSCFILKLAKLAALPCLLICLVACLLVRSERGHAQTPPAVPAESRRQDQSDVLRVYTELVQTDVMVFDKQGRFVEVVDNPYKDAGNAGIPTLDFLAGKGVKTVVAEGFGPKIVEVMKSKDMRPVEFKGNARDAVKKALESK